MFNTITVAGFLGNDAEKRTIPSGAEVTQLNIAVSVYKGKDDYETLWFSVSVWGKLAEHAAGFVKGDVVVASGEMSMDTYLDKNNEKQFRLKVNAHSLKRVPRPKNADIDPDAVIESQVADDDDPPF